MILDINGQSYKYQFAGDAIEWSQKLLSKVAGPWITGKQPGLRQDRNQRPLRHNVAWDNETVRTPNNTKSSFIIKLKDNTHKVVSGA